jgi:hypothetical protein
MQASKARNMITPFLTEGVTNIDALLVKSDNIDSRIDLILDEIYLGKSDPAIRQLVGKILSNVEEKDYMGELQAIFNWVRKNIRYTRDPYNLELFQKPKRILELKTADCDDLSILIGSMVQSIGFALRLRVIGVESPEPEHIYPMVQNPDNENDWVAMDASVKEKMGWEYPHEKCLFLQDYEEDDD